MGPKKTEPQNQTKSTHSIPRRGTILTVAAVDPARAQVQIIRPGDFPDTAVEIQLRQKCERDWPADFQMRAYCEKQQREAARVLSQEGPPGIQGDQAIGVRRKCAADWPADFQMRVYCEKQQGEALQVLSQGSPSDIPENQATVVRRKCASDWPADFQMRAYCEKQQYSAIRELSRR
jgi:hypothetical protein